MNKYIYEHSPNYGWDNPFNRRFIIAESECEEDARDYITKYIGRNIACLGVNPIIIGDLSDGREMNNFYCFDDKLVPLVIKSITFEEAKIIANKYGYNQLDSVNRNERVEDLIIKIPKNDRLIKNK